MSAFQKIQNFITEEMTMSQVYQPVMLIELLKNSGTATIEQIAQSILDKDPTQIEYFSAIVKKMVGKVLTNKRSITEKVGDTYKLIGCESLTAEETASLIALCQIKIEDFQDKRGDAPWEHRRRGHRPVSGSVRFEVLKRAMRRCELCGISGADKPLEVDHIHPKSLGGKDDLTNFQALCYSCNAAKRNTDDTDFRGYKSMYEHRESGCQFCEFQPQGSTRIIKQNNLAYVIRDESPATKGHILCIPKRHTGNYFDLAPAEVNAMNALIRVQKQFLEETDAKITGWNIGINCEKTAGQTEFHCHVHLIPRRPGDTTNTSGGVGF